MSHQLLIKSNLLKQLLLIIPSRNLNLKVQYTNQKGFLKSRKYKESMDLAKRKYHLGSNTCIAICFLASSRDKSFLEEPH